MIFALIGIERFFRLIDDGIDIRICDKHPLKACPPIEVTEEGIEICVNDEQ